MSLNQENEAKLVRFLKNLLPPRVNFGDNFDVAGANFYLEPGKVLFIENQDPYRIKAMSDCVLVEVTAGGGVVQNDSVMLEDDFGRTKKTSKSVSDIIKQ